MTGGRKAPSAALAAWPAPRVPLDRRAWPGIPTQIAARSAAAPHAPAVTQAGQVWSYRQLECAAAGIAAALEGAGVRPGEVVAVTGERGFAVVAAWTAVLARRAVLLPVDPLLPTARQQQMLQQARATRLMALGKAPVLSDVPVVHLDGALADRLRLDDGAPGPEPEEPGYVFFTSGSTGPPKAIVGRHRSLAQFLHWQRETFAVGPGDRVPHLASAGFDVALREVFLPLTSGATLCLPPRGPIPAPRSLAWLAEERATILHTVPTVARAWLRAAAAGPRLPHLRAVLLSGEPLPGALVDQWRQQLHWSGQVVNLYGPTETTLVRCWHQITDPAEKGIQPLGRPIPGSQVRVHCPDGLPAAAGEVGEIVIRTAYGTSGYRGASAEEAARFTFGPGGEVIYRTGDLGHLDTEGVLHFDGRLDDEIKVYGVRVHLRAVEAALEAQPGIEQAAVTAETDDSGGPPRLTGHLVLAPGHREVPAGLRGALHQRLPPAAIPARLVAVASLPATHSGKLDRRRLTDQDTAPTRPDIPATLTKESS